MGEEHRMVIPGIQALVPDICDFVSATARRANLNERAVYHCQMAVDEACTNIIEHGFGGSGKRGTIEVVCREAPDRYTVAVYDDGPPFNPIQREDPDPNTPLAEREPGGWGIFFIKKMMDEVEYSFEESRNCLTLTKYRTPANLALPGESRPPSGDTVQELIPGVWGVAPTDRLDSNSAPALQALLDAQLDAGRVNLLVDMTRIAFISTSGLKALVSIWRRAQNASGQLVLAGMNPNVQEVFETVGFDQLFAIFDTVDLALGHFDRKSE